MLSTISILPGKVFGHGFPLDGIAGVVRPPDGFVTTVHGPAVRFVAELPIGVLLVIGSARLPAAVTVAAVFYASPGAVFDVVVASAVGRRRRSRHPRGGSGVAYLSAIMVHGIRR